MKKEPDINECWPDIKAWNEAWKEFERKHGGAIVDKAISEGRAEIVRVPLRKFGRLRKRERR